MQNLLFALFLLIPSLLRATLDRVQPLTAAQIERALQHEREQGIRIMPPRQKITTFLWFDDAAEEAIRFYSSIFPDSKLLSETRWGEGGPVPEGTPMTARFQLAGQEFMALNGGPQFPFTEAISLVVNCETQAEVDTLWKKLIAGGGEPGRCGWLKDKFGLSWQVVPTALEKMLQDGDPARAKRVMDALMQMDKLDLRRLQQAYDQR